MYNAKNEIIKTLQRLPENSSFEAVQYAASVRAVLQKGLDESDGDEFYTLEEIEKSMKECYSSYCCLPYESFN